VLKEFAAFYAVTAVNGAVVVAAAVGDGDGADFDDDAVGVAGAMCESIDWPCWVVVSAVAAVEIVGQLHELSQEHPKSQNHRMTSSSYQLQAEKDGNAKKKYQMMLMRRTRQAMAKSWKRRTKK
jgi:hypothetical protein